MRKRSSKKPFAVEVAERQLFLDAVERLPLYAKGEIEIPHFSPKPRPQKDKMIQATLDLHGLTQEEASLRLKVFIERCLFLGYRRICIIHGKGSGVLRQCVRDLLGKNSCVTQVQDAPPRLGGDGAVIAYLRNRESGGSNSI